MKKTRFMFLLLILVAFAPRLMAGDLFVKHEKSESPDIKPDSGNALVFFVRPSSMGFAIKTWAFVDDAPVGVTKAKGYVVAEVEAGQHLFWSKAENVSALEMEVEGGKTYYLKQSPRFGVMKARVKLVPLDAKPGKKALSKCRYYELTDEGWVRGTEIAAERIAKAEKKAADREASMD
jgi:hypothetical protein